MASNPTTLATLITEVRQRTNTESSQFVTDAEITGYLNNSLAMLDAILVSKFDDYKLTKVLLSVNAGTNVISLPADFLKLRGVDIWAAPGERDGYITCREYAWQERNKKIYGAILLNTAWTPADIEYRLEDQGITILPATIASNFQYRINYTPDFVPFSLSPLNYSATLPAYMDSQLWRQYAVYDTAAQIQAKQELDAQFFLIKAGELKEHLVHLATPNRDSGEPKCVGTSDRIYMSDRYLWGI